MLAMYLAESHLATECKMNGMLGAGELDGS